MPLAKADSGQQPPVDVAVASRAGEFVELALATRLRLTEQEHGENDAGGQGKRSSPSDSALQRSGDPLGRTDVDTAEGLARDGFVPHFAEDYRFLWSDWIRSRHKLTVTR